MNPRNRNILIAAVLIVVVAVAAFFGLNSNKKSSQASSSKTVNVGIMAGSEEVDETWKTVSKLAKDKYGITIKLTHFTDYSQPNKALNDGDVDVNAFQTYGFLDTWNEANKATLTPIGDTTISPMRVYSNKIKSLNDLSEGASVAVPNDAVNESRALYVLQSAGVIKLDSKGGELATVKSIVSNPKKLSIKEVDASQTARSLDSVEAAVVNDNYAKAAKLKPEQVIFIEPITKNSQKVINVIAVKEKDKDNEVYKNIVKAFQSQETKDTLLKVYPQKTTIAAWDIKL